MLVHRRLLLNKKTTEQYVEKVLTVVAPSSHVTVWPLILLIWHQPVKSTCIAQMHVRLLKKRKKYFEVRDLSARNKLQINDCITIHLAK